VWVLEIGMDSMVMSCIGLEELVVVDSVFACRYIRIAEIGESI